MATAGSAAREGIDNPFADRPTDDEADGAAPRRQERRRQRQQEQQAQEEPPVVHVSGYDANFDPPLDKKLECPICLYALRDPIQTTCGHRFCRSCIEKSLTENKMCPVDKRKLTKADIFPDNWCRREVMTLHCKCRHSADGCPWEGQLKDFEDHIDRDCEHTTMTCPNEGCNMAVPRRTLQRHLDEVCQYRTVHCQYCGDVVSVRAVDDHNSLHCTKFPRECPQNCGEQVPRCELENHLANICERSRIQCPFPACDWEGDRRQHNAHRNELHLKHLDLVCNLAQTQAGSTLEIKTAMVAVKKELAGVTRMVEGLAAAVQGDSAAMQLAQRTRVKLEDVSRQVDHTVVRVSDVESKLLQLERKVAVDRADMTALSEKLERTTAAMQSNMAQLITIMEQQSAGIAAGSSFPFPSMAKDPGSAGSIPQQPPNTSTLVTSNPVPTDPAVSYDGRMIWKVQNWKELRTSALEGKRPSVYSSPFYTDLRGYKVRVRLYPNGDGMGKGNSLSVFFTLCRGEFDALLAWPFRSKVTFTLKDQVGGMDVAESFVPDSNSTSFHKPRTDMNIASGCPLFAPLTRVSGEGSYVLNDTIQIQVVVEPQKSPR